MLSKIRTELISDPQINALVGQKIFVAYAPKEIQAPYILLDELFRAPNDCKREQSTVDNYTFVVTAVDERWSTVETLLKRVRQVLDGFSDDFYRGVSFDGIQDHYDGTQDYHVSSNNYKSLVNVL